jgi:hypothetical protein
MQKKSYILLKMSKINEANKNIKKIKINKFLTMISINFPNKMDDNKELIP